ncbi:glycosyltransferase family 9 protein [bacterium 1xD42-87]|nr:glycosyltransferase family 9 protein [bacterium 1xD42-87]
MRYLVDIHHGIGDCICFMPTIDNIAIADEHAVIDIVVLKQNYGDLFLNNPNIRNVIALSDAPKMFAPGKYDIGIIADFISAKWMSVILLKYLGCKKVVYVHRKLKWTKHLVLRCLDVLELLGIEYTIKKPQLYLDDRKAEICDKYDFGKEMKTIAVCMGGNVINNVSVKNRAMKGVNFKQWPYKRYVKLIRILGEKYKVILIGGDKEEKEFANYRDAVNLVNVLNIIGKTSLPESAQILSACDLVIGNDTGMMHLAGAAGTATLSIHGPTDPDMCGTFSERAFFITPKTKCKYCYAERGDKYFNCTTGLSCLMSISVDDVIKKVDEILV